MEYLSTLSKLAVPQVLLKPTSWDEARGGKIERSAFPYIDKTGQ
jgi:hypothetical protein